jgi:hypothetical protein
MPEILEIRETLQHDLKLGYCESVRLLFRESKRAAIVGIGMQVL